MSFLIITEDHKMMSLNDFLLSESIRPKEIKFGTNPETDNLKFKTIDTFTGTFFTALQAWFAVVINSKNGDVMFGISEQFSDKFSAYTDEKIRSLNSSQVPRIFSFVFFIVIQLLKKEENQLKEIRFSGTPVTGNLYKRLVRNKAFLEELENIGFSYRGFVDDYYIFIKKQPLPEK